MLSASPNTSGGALAENDLLKLKMSIENVARLTYTMFNPIRIFVHLI